VSWFSFWHDGSKRNSFVHKQELREKLFDSTTNWFYSSLSLLWWFMGLWVGFAKQLSWLKYLMIFYINLWLLPKKTKKEEEPSPASLLPPLLAFVFCCHCGSFCASFRRQGTFIDAASADWRCSFFRFDEICIARFLLFILSSSGQSFWLVAPAGAGDMTRLFDVQYLH